MSSTPPRANEPSLWVPPVKAPGVTPRALADTAEVAITAATPAASHFRVLVISGSLL